ncbi:hypothetical protein CsSME_00052112 [Camellia sinensis var. sinensis]
MALVGELFLCLLLLWLYALTFCQAKQNWENQYPFIKRASSFPSSSSSSSTTSSGGDKAYDYIIIGGGTTGCPLAATLSRNFSVLLLERGGVPFVNQNVTNLKNFHLTLADTSPSSASQAFISTDGVFNSRARVLGGGTCINAGFYTRASTRYHLSLSLCW